MSLLSIVANACGEVGLTVPTAVFTNSDANIVQMLYLAQRTGKELAENTQAAGYWERLRVQYTLTTVGYGPYTCTITAGSTTISAISNMTGIAVGQQVYASGLVNDTIVLSVGASSVVVSQAPTSTITLTGQSVVFAQEAYPLPADLAYIINQTEWDRNFRWQLLGPINAQEWQVIKSGISPVGPRMRFRIFGGNFNINPVGSASSVYTDTIALEYVSSNWVATAAAPTVPAQSAFAQDTDVSLISEDLLTIGIKWRFLKAKGLAYEDDFQQYQDKYNKLIGRDAAARNLPLNARAGGVRLLNSANVPDTGFGS